MQLVSLEPGPPSSMPSIAVPASLSAIATVPAANWFPAAPVTLENAPNVAVPAPTATSPSSVSATRTFLVETPLGTGRPALELDVHRDDTTAVAAGSGVREP